MGPGAGSAAAATAPLAKATAVSAGTWLTRYAFRLDTRVAHVSTGHRAVPMHPMRPMRGRYLVEAPPNVCNPQYLAAAAQWVADLSPATMKVCGLCG